MKYILSRLSRNVLFTSLLAITAGAGCVSGTGENDGNADSDEGDPGALQPQGAGGSGGTGGTGGTGGAPADPGWSVETSLDALALTGVTDTAYADAYVIRGLAGITNVPLDQGIKDEMMDDFKSRGDDNAVYMVSPKALAAIAEAEATGKLSDDLVALSDGEDPVLLGSCGDQIRTAHKGVPLSFSTSGSQSFGGGFTGTYSFSASVTGSANADLNYRVKRKSVWGICVPYLVVAENVHLYGSMNAQAGDGIDGSLGANFSWSREIAKPGIGSLVFMVGPVPVVIGLNLPITVGIDIQATGSGSLHLQGQSVYASGGFDYTCTFGGCSGSSNFSMPNPGQPNLAAGISGRVKADAWLDAAARVFLYSDAAAYAQIGVRPHLFGDLWAYYGNDCGDADGDGANETVSAATFDLDWQVMLTAKAGIGGGSQFNNADLAHTQRRLIKFWDLLGNSSALTPMVQGTANPHVGWPAGYTVKMRPCWPYQSDTAIGSIAWGDGSTNGAYLPSSPSHTYGSTGTRTISLTAQSDFFGRNFGSGKTTSRTVNVTP